MQTLNITLPPEAFALVKSGAKRIVSTKRNARKDRYFDSKKPTAAKINGTLFNITNIEIDQTTIHIHFR